MPITLTAIPAGASGARKPISDIDPDVIAAIEDAYLHCSEVPGERVQAGFPTQEEADAFLADARSYAYQRDAGRLVVSGNTTKKGFARFRVTAYVAPEASAEADAA